LSVDEDYYLPVRGSESGTKIDTLAGGQNATAIEDVEYIQKKLFAALKIPKAYLGYDEGLGAKATLSQEDVRFSRTINRIQRTVISELNKIAIIHLYCNGFEGEDLLDFQLRLSNPSTIAQQQKLELYRTRFDVATTANNIEGLVSRDWVRKNIFNMTDDQIDSLLIQREEDKLNDLRIESVTLPAENGDQPDTDDIGGEGGGPPPPAPPGPDGDDGAEVPTDLADSDNLNKNNLTVLSEPDFRRMSLSDESSPVRVQQRVDNIAKSLGEVEDKGYQNRKRRVNSVFPDLSGMVEHDPDDTDDSVSGQHEKHQRYKRASERKEDVNPASVISREIQNASKLPSVFEADEIYINDFLDEKTQAQNRMTDRLKSTLKSLERTIHIKRPTTLLSEENEV
jgi:hypothetical protein